MVDRICELKQGSHIRGIKNVSWDDDFLEENFSGIPVFSPVIAAEAVAQLLSWLIIASTDFTVKPVITMLDRFAAGRPIMVGDQLRLEGEIESLSPDSALTHGRILVNGAPAVELTHAVCYFYPLHELDPPEQVRNQFRNLYAEGLPGPCGAVRPVIMREKIAVRNGRWLDSVIPGDTPERLQGIKNVTATDDVFRDHFPLKPVLPGVFTIEIMVNLATRLAAQKLAMQGTEGKRPVVHSLQKIKFRKFILPGDQLQVDAAVVDFAPEKSSLRATVTCGRKTAASVTVECLHLDRQAYAQRCSTTGHRI